MPVTINNEETEEREIPRITPKERVSQRPPASESAQETSDEPPGQETGESELTSFLQNNFDETYSLPPFLDKVFAGVDNDQIGGARDAYYAQTNDSRFQDYEPFLNQLSRVDPTPEDDQFGFFDKAIEGLARRANGFIRSYNEVAGADLSLFNEVRSLNDDGIVDFFNHDAVFFVGAGVSFAGLGAFAASSMFFGGYAFSYLNEHDRLDSNAHDFIVTTLAGAEGLLPDSEEELLSMSNAEFLTKMWAAETLNTATILFGLKGLQKFGKGVGDAGVLRFFSKARKEKALLDEALPRIERDIHKIKAKPLFSDDLSNVTTRSLSSTDEAGVRAIRGVGTRRDFRNNSAIIRAYREANTFHEASGAKDAAASAHNTAQVFARKHALPTLDTTATTAARAVDQREIAGKSLAALKHATTEAGKRRALERHVNAVSHEILETKGIQKSPGAEGRAEQFAKESATPLGERYGTHGEATGSLPYALMEADDLLFKEWSKEIAKDPHSVLARQIERSVEANRHYTRILGTQTGGALQGFDLFRSYDQAITGLDSAIAKASVAGNYKKANKLIASRNEFMQDMMAGKQPRSLKFLAAGTNFYVNTLLGQGALMAAAAGNVATTAYEIFAHNVTHLTNPLPALREGLTQAAMESPRLLNIKRILTEAGGKIPDDIQQQFARIDWVPESKIGRGVKAVSNLPVQLMRETDTISRGLMSYVTADRAINRMVDIALEKGHKIGEIKSYLENAVVNSKPTAALVELNATNKVYQDRIMMRYRGQDRASGPLAAFGWAVDDAVTGLKDSPNILVKGTTGLIGVFSVTFANILDHTSRNTVLGAKFGLKPVSRRQLLGTVTALGSVMAFEDKIVMPSFGLQSRQKFYKFGGQEGLILGDQLVSFHHLGGPGEILRTTLKAIQVLNYMGAEEAETEYAARLGTALTEVTNYVAQDSWLAQGLTDVINIFFASNTNRDVTDSVQRTAWKFLPANVVIDRIATIFRGYKISDEGQGPIKNLLDVLRGAEGAPLRSAFGVPITTGEVNHAHSRGISDVANFAMWVLNPAKRGPAPKQTELVQYLSNAGMLQGRKAFTVRSEKGEKIIGTEFLPEYFNVKMSSLSPIMTPLPGVRSKLTSTELNDYKALISLDKDAINGILDKYTLYYDSSIEHEGELEVIRRQGLQAIRNIKNLTRKGGALDGLVRQFYGAPAGVTMVDVLHKLATGKVSEQSPSIKSRLKSDARMYYNDMRRRDIATKHNLTDNDLKRISLTLSRNFTVKQFYNHVGDIMKSVMLWAPSSDEKRRSVLSKGSRFGSIR